MERETGFEPATFSLEGWRSTNWATLALWIYDWELFILDLGIFKFKIVILQSEINCGESRIRTCEDVVSRFTVCPRWPLEYLPFFKNFNILMNFHFNFEPIEGLEPTTCWLQISCSSQLSYIGFFTRIFPKKTNINSIVFIRIPYKKTNRFF